MSVGEILCEQLLDADVTLEALRAVWADINALPAESHSMTEFMVDALVSACARTDGGLEEAVEMLRDGKHAGGPLASSALQTSAVCAMFKWLSDDKRLTFDYAVSLVDEWERTPADFERLQTQFYVHYGYDPMCHWHGMS